MRRARLLWARSCSARASVMSSQAHSPWVDMYYRRPKHELRPLVDRFLGQCDDVNGFVRKVRDRSKSNLDVGIIDTVCNGLRQADEDLHRKHSRVQNWLTELDGNPGDEGEEPSGNDAQLHTAQSPVSPLSPGASASSYFPSPPPSNDQAAPHKSDASSIAISVSIDPRRTFLAGHPPPPCCESLTCISAADACTHALIWMDLWAHAKQMRRVRTGPL